MTEPLGAPIYVEVCTHCLQPITAAELCAYECPYDATPHRDMKRALVYEPVAEIRPTTPVPKAQSAQTGGTNDPQQAPHPRSPARR